jgi:HEAT repeat protein
VSAEEAPKPKPQPWQIDGIMAALEDDLPRVKQYALDKLTAYDLQNLKSVGREPEDIAKKAAEILKDEKVDANVRASAASALSNFGQAAAKYVPDIVNILKDEKVDANLRASAARALGNITQLKLEEVIVILNYVYEPNQGKLWSTLSSNRENRDNINFEYWRFLTHVLAGGNDEVKTLLKWLGKPDRKAIPEQLKYDEGKKTLELFLKIWVPTQGLQGLREDLEEQISVVASNKKVLWKPQDISLLESHYKNLKAVNSTKAAAVKSVIDNLEFWKWFFLARNIILTHLAIWLTLILAYPKSPQVQTIFWNPWVRRILGFGYIGLLLSWVPYLRRRLFEPFKPILLADAGLDNFSSLTYFPESGVVETLHGASLHQDRGEIRPITQAIPTITGQIVLEGDSGLGKSMFLRHLVKTSQQIVAYLPAQKCDNGVIEAIYAKLQGQVQDAKFLRNLIYYGAIDICIDGLNEVTADTRAKVSQFAESYFRGNIIMTTQPLDWIPPSTAKKYELQPLEREQIQQFLISRQQQINLTLPYRVDFSAAKSEGEVKSEMSVRRNLTLPYRASLSLLRRGKDFSAAKSEGEVKSEMSVRRNPTPPSFPLPASGEQRRAGVPPVEATAEEGLGVGFQDYEQACARYIAAAFNDQQSKEDLAAAKRILSNPMDLTLVALMLSQGKQPDLFRLQEQQYHLMAEEYLRKWNHEFPLKKFSQAVYQMRLNDQSAIPAEEFNQELISMEDEKYKMVISRQWEDAEGEPHKSWYFRHDKIMEFFLVQNFLGEGEEVQERVNEHINDPRFRGVYLLLATLLPVDVALVLRERLIEYAANTKDHTLTDKFVQILKLRLPQQWTQDGSLKHLLRQQEHKAKCLDLVSEFLELVGAKIKRDSQHLTIKTIEGSLSPYTPLPVLLSVDTPSDKDVIQLVEISEKLVLDCPERIGILFYRVSPDTTARIEMAKVRLRDHFVLIPIPLAELEQALPNQDKCRGLLEVYVDRYLQRVDFFDDKNAISDTFSFFGRTEVLQLLGQELLRYQGIGLFGLRKSGKTSVLLQLGFMLRQHPIIHIDLQGFVGSRYGVALFNRVLSSLSSLESEVQLPQFPPFPLEKPAAELSGEFIQRVIDFASAIQKTKKYKLPILCFLDEVERIIPTPEDSREKAEEFNACFGALRVLCQEQRQLSLLVADVHPDCNRINMWKQQGVATNPVFSFFKEVFLPPFAEEETKDMLINIGKLMGLEFDEQTPKQIHRQSGGHPFVSRQLARFLTEKIQNKNQDKNTNPSQSRNMLIEWAMVERYLEKTLSHKGELKNYLEKSIWEDLEKRNFDVAIAVLQAIACNEHFREGITEQALLNQLRDNFTTSQCLDACLWLTNVGLLYHEEVEHQDFYQIRIPLLSRWIQMQMTEEEIEQCKIFQ